MRGRLRQRLGLACAAVLGVCATGAAGQEAPAPQDLVPYHVQGKVYALIADDMNLAVQTGADGAVLVNAYKAGMTEQVLAAVRTVSDKPIHYVINTQVGAGQVGGNEVLKKVGTSRPDRRPLAAGVGGNTAGNVTVLAHENVLRRMTGAAGEEAAPAPMWPTDTYYVDVHDFFFNDEAVQLYHAPAAHSDGDSIVFFRRSDVIATGNIFLTTTYPVIDLERGGTVNGLIDALNLVIRLAVPSHNQEGGTMIVPGQGRIGDEMDVVEYRNMVTIVRDRVRNLIGRGLSLEQVRAERPTLDYDPRYGRTEGPWTTSMFVEAVYRSLSAEAAAQETR